MDAGYAEAHNNMGILLKDVGRARDALDSYDRCLALEPSNRCGTPGAACGCLCLVPQRAHVS